MKYCIKCGTAINDDDKHCWMCGAKQDTKSKISLYISLIALVSTFIGFSIYFNIISIVLSFVSFVLLFMKKEQKYKDYSIGLNIFVIIGSILLIIYSLL